MGSGTDAYWGILSLCLDLHIARQCEQVDTMINQWIIVVSTGFPPSLRATYRIFIVIIRMGPICLQYQQGLKGFEPFVLQK